MEKPFDLHGLYESSSLMLKMAGVFTEFGSPFSDVILVGTRPLPNAGLVLAQCHREWLNNKTTYIVSTSFWEVYLANASFNDADPTIKQCVRLRVFGNNWNKIDLLYV